MKENSLLIITENIRALAEIKMIPLETERGIKMKVKINFEYILVMEFM